MSEVFHHEEDDRRYEVMKTDRLSSQNSISVLNGNSDIETAIAEEREEQDMHNNVPRLNPQLQQLAPSAGVTDSSSNTALISSTMDDRYLNTM